MGNIYSEYDFITVKNTDYDSDIIMHLGTGYYNISKANHYTIQQTRLLEYDINKWFKKNSKLLKKLEKTSNGKNKWFKLGSNTPSKYRGIYVCSKIYNYILLCINSDILIKPSKLDTIKE